MRRPWILAVALVGGTQGQAQPAFLGYTAASARTQGDLERRLQALVTPQSLSALHRPLAQRPHPAGTPASRAVAAHLERTLRSFGWEVDRHEYRAWLSHPRSVEVSLLAPQARPLSLREPVIGADPTSAHPELADGSIAYSASGDVTAPVVYANYGLPADYAALARAGVSPRGAIVLVRYGRSHRAVKVHAAQEAGARAVVLYSDPADDGFVKGPAWPEGYWRGEQMLQRGNAKLSWYFHGDPLTPGVAATADAPRLAPDTAPTLPRIPVVAISWGEARHVLQALAGSAAPAGFRGGVPGVEWKVGPGPATLRVRVQMNDGLAPIHNVVATLRGRSQPDRIVMLGGHHDAWTFGAVDPGTGSAALLEVARVLGRLARGGWRPERTIQVAFWDAEEFGLVGSTEHAEHFRRALQEQLVLYVNIDMYMRGRFDPGGVPSLRDFVEDVTRGVVEEAAPGGDRRRTVFEAWAGDTLPGRPRALVVTGVAPGAAARPDLKALGSGADFVPFQDFLAVPTLSIEFIGANGYGFGTYHTNYDSRAYVERVADPGFRQGATMARVLGTLAVRMANAEVLPFRFANYAARWRAGLVEMGRATGDAGPTALGSAVLLATRLEQAIDDRLARGRLPAADARVLNDRLARVEQLLADDDGAPGRAWFRHVYYGWNIYSLYDGQPFPGLSDAVSRGDAPRIAVEQQRVERALVRFTRALEEALTLVEGSSR